MAARPHVLVSGPHAKRQHQRPEHPERPQAPARHPPGVGRDGPATLRIQPPALHLALEHAACSARQLVRHNGVLVNGKRVNIPSYDLRPGDTVELAEKTRGHLRVKAALEAAESRGFPEWVEVDAKSGKGVFKAYPARTDLPATINESLVVELYSR